MEPEERYLAAAYDGNWEYMKTVLAMYPDVSCEKAVEYAIRGGHMTIVENLLRKKKHCMSIFDMSLMAAEVGNVDNVQYMLEQEEPTMELVSRMAVMATRNENIVPHE
jgi:hypothetical protein